MPVPTYQHVHNQQKRIHKEVSRHLASINFPYIRFGRGVKPTRLVVKAAAPSAKEQDIPSVLSCSSACRDREYLLPDGHLVEGAPLEAFLDAGTKVHILNFHVSKLWVAASAISTHFASLHFQTARFKHCGN